MYHDTLNQEKSLRICGSFPSIIVSLRSASSGSLDHILLPATYLAMLPILAVGSAQIILFYLTRSIFATPLLLDLPTVFESPISNSTALTIINSTVVDADPCSLPRPDRSRATFYDCEAVISSMRRITDRRRYTFGRGGSSVTYTLPRTFMVRTCALVLDMVHDHQTDELTFPEIRQHASNLAAECTAGTAGAAFDRGGLVAVGPKKELYITILGMELLDTS